MSNQTIVALYDDTAAAGRVLTDLQAAGFASGDFWVSGDDTYGASGGSTGRDRFDTLRSGWSSRDTRVSSLTDLGVPRDEAEVYWEGVRRGGVLLVGMVDDDDCERALEIIERHGPADIAERAIFYRESGWTGYDTAAADYDEAQAVEERSRYPSGLSAAASALRDTDRTASGREEVIPVTEEQLDIGKREVERGRVRVRSYVVETPVEENVTLRDETVNVERRPVDREVTDVPADAFRERTVEVAETDEEAVVAKRARVTEEVVVRKDVAEESRTVGDTVRRTEVEVDDSRTDRTGKGTPTGRDRTDI